MTNQLNNHQSLSLVATMLDQLQEFVSPFQSILSQIHTWMVTRFYTSCQPTNTILLDGLAPTVKKTDKVNQSIKYI